MPLSLCRAERLAAAAEAAAYTETMASKDALRNSLAGLMGGGAGGGSKRSMPAGGPSNTSHNTHQAARPKGATSRVAATPTAALQGVGGNRGAAAATAARPTAAVAARGALGAADAMQQLAGGAAGRCGVGSTPGTTSCSSGAGQASLGTGELGGFRGSGVNAGLSGVNAGLSGGAACGGPPILTAVTADTAWAAVTEGPPIDRDPALVPPSEVAPASMGHTTVAALPDAALAALVHSPPPPDASPPPTAAVGMPPPASSVASLATAIGDYQGTASTTPETAPERLSTPPNAADARASLPQRMRTLTRTASHLRGFGRLLDHSDQGGQPQSLPALSGAAGMGTLRVDLAAPTAGLEQAVGACACDVCAGGLTGAARGGQRAASTGACTASPLTSSVPPSKVMLIPRMDGHRRAEAGRQASGPARAQAWTGQQGPRCSVWASAGSTPIGAAEDAYYFRMSDPAAASFRHAYGLESRAKDAHVRRLERARATKQDNAAATRQSMEQALALRLADLQGY